MRVSLTLLALVLAVGCGDATVPADAPLSAEDAADVDATLCQISADVMFEAPAQVMPEFTFALTSAAYGEGCLVTVRTDVPSYPYRFYVTDADVEQMTELSLDPMPAAERVLADVAPGMAKGGKDTDDILVAHKDCQDALVWVSDGANWTRIAPAGAAGLGNSCSAEEAMLAYRSMLNQ